MEDLRTRLIKLAYENPELREDLVPILASRSEDLLHRMGTALMEAEDSSVVAESHGRTLVHMLDDPEFKRAMKAYRSSLKDYHRASRELRILIGQYLKRK